MSEQFTESDRQHAIMQGEQNAATDAYIDARPQLDSIHNRRIFEAGFERGWNAAATAANEQISELGKWRQVAELRAQLIEDLTVKRDWLQDNLAAEREVSDKLEKALKYALKHIDPKAIDMLKWSSGKQPWHVNSIISAALAEVAAARAK